MWGCPKMPPRIIQVMDDDLELNYKTGHPSHSTFSEPTPIGSMVLLYMVCHGSHQYTPFMLAYIPAPAGSVMGHEPIKGDKKSFPHWTKYLPTMAYRSIWLRGSPACIEAVEGECANMSASATKGVEYKPYNYGLWPIINNVLLSFGNNRGAGLVYHLSSFPCC